MAEDWNGREYTRINTWKRIAAYLGEEVEVVQGWARETGLPVHRWPDGERGGVFAYTGDLDGWMRDEVVKADAPGRTSLDATTGGGALVLDSVPRNGVRVGSGRGTEWTPAGEGSAVEAVKSAESGEPAESVELAETGREARSVEAAAGTTARPAAMTRAGGGPDKPAGAKAENVLGQRGQATRGFLVCAAGVFVAVLMAALLHSVQGISLREVHPLGFMGLGWKAAPQTRPVSFESSRRDPFAGSSRAPLGGCGFLGPAQAGPAGSGFVLAGPVLVEPAYGGEPRACEGADHAGDPA